MVIKEVTVKEMLFVKLAILLLACMKRSVLSFLLFLGLPGNTISYGNGLLLRLSMMHFSPNILTDCLFGTTGF